MRRKIIERFRCTGNMAEDSPQFLDSFSLMSIRSHSRRDTGCCCGYLLLAEGLSEIPEPNLSQPWCSHLSHKNIVSYTKQRKYRITIKCSDHLSMNGWNQSSVPVGKRGAMAHSPLPREHCMTLLLCSYIQSESRPSESPSPSLSMPSPQFSLTLTEEILEVPLSQSASRPSISLSPSLSIPSAQISAADVDTTLDEVVFSPALPTALSWNDSEETAAASTLALTPV